MKKLNNGFSLFVLIVVIAIMAILVGVLAPAYLKYVEKSRKSKDIDAVAEMMGAAEKVAVDNETVGDDEIFYIEKQGDELELHFVGDPDVTDDWGKASGLPNNKYVLSSKVFKNSADGSRLTGLVNHDEGPVIWSGTGFFAKSGSGTLGDLSGDYAKRLC